MDENFQTYLNRAMRLILPETYQSQVQNIQESPKFRSQPQSGFLPNPFPGYTIITPPEGEESDNITPYTHLKQFQQQILEQLGTDVFAPLPPDSFHVTLADLIWKDAYYHALEEKPDFESQLQDEIRYIFQQCALLSEGKPIQFQILGLMLMTRAIAVCLVPVDEPSYDRVLKFRRAIYQNRNLIGLGIEQQYYFTPHITLGYFGAEPPVEQRAQLAERIIALNQQWLQGEPQPFLVHRAELRKFDDMTRYYREPNWAMFQF